MKRKFLAFFTFMMLMIFASAFVACTDYEKPEEQEKEKQTVTYEQVAKNGTFYDVSSTDKDDVYDTVSNWTVTSAGFSAPGNGKNQALGVFAGALDLTGNKIGNIIDSYQIRTQENQDENGDDVPLDTPVAFTNPGVDPATPKTDKLDDDGNVIEGAEKVYQDTNAFLFASTKTRGSIYLKSGSITLTKNSVYKFSFSVCTKMFDATNEDACAFVFIRGDMEKEFKIKDNGNTWETKTMYIETNRESDVTITVELWLGYGPKKSTSSTYENDGNDKYAVRGYAMFDNIVFTKLVEEVENEQTEALFSSVYAGYASNASLHENFLAFSAGDVDSYSSYYLKDADLANRTHLTSSTYFNDTSDYRKYFYDFRDYSSSNTSSTYWGKMSDFTAGNDYYGIVDLSKMYKGDTLNYSKTKSEISSKTLMDKNEWEEKVMARAASQKENYALMIYNNKLGASGFVTADSNSVTIDANKYYKISVWAYVWTTTYEGKETYKGSDAQAADKSPLPAYSATKKPEEKKDPRTDTKYTSQQRSVYSVFEKYNAENSASTLAGVNYFADLNDAEKEDLKGFTSANVTTVMNEFKKITNSGTNKKYYDEIIAAIKEWLVGNQDTFGLTIADNDTAPMEAFLFTYLYYSYNYNGTIVPTKLYGDDTQNVLQTNFAGAVGTDIGVSDFLRKAYLLERSENIALEKEMDKVVKNYDEIEKPQYEKDLAEYDKLVKQYKTECETWLNANQSIPHATFRVSGAGDEYDAVTEKVSEWEQLVVYIQGNQLSDRSVSLSLIFGENDNITTKMIGGVFFDNVEIEEVTADASDAWHVLSEIKDESEISFGGLIKNTTDTTEPTTAGWNAEKGADTAALDGDLLKVEVVADDYLKEITIGNDKYNSYKLVYTHTDATASTLQYKPLDNTDAIDNTKLIEILPNKYYRFAFQVKTTDLKTGASITLLKRQDGDFSDFSTGVSSYVSDDWSEVVYYIQGDKDGKWYLSIEISVGSGNRRDTSSYEKGSVELASFNCLEITKSEYDSHKTGDKIVDSLSLYNKSSDIDGDLLKNASYGAIDYANTKETDFDDDGIKVGSIVPAQNWTAGDVYTNSFTAPAVTLENGILTWPAVDGYKQNPDYDPTDESSKKYLTIHPDRYEIWATYRDDNNKEQKILIDANGYTGYDLASLNYTQWRDCTLSVVAISSDAVSVPSAAVTVSNPADNNNIIPEQKTDGEGNKPVETTVKSGAKKVTNDFDGSAYSSNYEYIYAIKADYKAAVAVKSAALSLSANKYYKISVWVKTDDSATASIVLTGTDGSVEANVTKAGVIGYSGISTKIKDTNVNEWTEYSIYLKTGNFSVSPYINLCLGNPFAKTQKVGSDSDAKTYYNDADVCIGSVYFDAVRVSEIKEAEYETADKLDKNAEGVCELPEDEKLVYKNVGLKSYVYTVRYTIDSFDNSEKLTTDANKYGKKPNNYTRANGDNVDTNDATYSNIAYGVYNANADVSDEDMYSALSYLYGNGSKLLFNNYFGDNTGYDNNKLADYDDAQWREFLKNFLKLNNTELVKDGGDNVLVLSNKIASGIAQKYTLDSGYKVSIAGNGYYKLTFAANTLIAKPNFDVVTVSDADKTNWSTAKSNYYVKSGSKYIVATADYDVGTNYYKVRYTYDDCYAELRYVSGEKNADDMKMYISSYDKDTGKLYGSQTYTVYIHNKSASAKDATWNFYLGDGKSVENSMYNKLLVGMLAVDLVSMEKIDEDAYAAGIEGVYDAEGNLVNEHSKIMKYEYAEDEETATDNKDNDDDDDDEEPKEKEDFWKRLIEDDYFWLYISSVVLAIVIIVVVVVVLVRKYKEKHPKKVVGENNVKTIKDFKDVVEPEAQEKEEALEADEYVDEIDIRRPVVQQRVLPKKNKKKKKK